MQGLSVMRDQSHDPLAGSGCLVVVDVFRGSEPFPDSSKAIDRPGLNVEQFGEHGHIGEEQSLEFMHLDIRQHSFFAAAGLALDFAAQEGLQVIDRTVALVLETVEVDQ